MQRHRLPTVRMPDFIHLTGLPVQAASHHRYAIQEVRGESESPQGES